MTSTENVVSAINAHPETVRVFLTSMYYNIPDYQRPYSWKEEECTKLWEDLVEYHTERMEAERMQAKGDHLPYFLGNIITYNTKLKTNTGDREWYRNVVDGQQRLITLNLLIKALFRISAEKYDELRKTLYEVDKRSGKVNSEKLRVIHRVLEEKGDADFSRTMHGHRQKRRKLLQELQII